MHLYHNNSCSTAAIVTPFAACVFCAPAQVRDHSQAILCLSPTPHADRLLTASKDNQLRLWDFRQLGTLQVCTAVRPH